MVRCFLLSWYGVVWGVVALALWAAGAKGAAPHYDTATPHTPPHSRHKYIPLQYSGPSYDRYSPDNLPSPVDPQPPSSGMPPSQFILTALRTVLDVVRNMNANRLPAAKAASNNTAVTIHRRSGNSTAAAVSGRGYDYYDEHDHDHETTTTTTPKPMKQSRYTDPWAGYYDWIINEGSFKFWSAFQLFTAALLLYACLSAIYYAKFNPIIPDYDREYDDYFLERTVNRQARSLDSWELPSGLSWINPRTFQFIIDAISKHYEEE